MPYLQRMLEKRFFEEILYQEEDHRFHYQKPLKRIRNIEKIDLDVRKLNNTN